MKTLLSYGLGVVSIVIMLGAIIPALQGSLKYVSARLLMMNLLRTNPNQAEQVANSVKGTFFEALAAAIKTAAMMQSRDPEMIRKGSVPAYDATASAISMRFKGFLTKAKLGAMAVAGAVAIGFSGDSTPVLMIILALAVGGGIVFLLVKQAEVNRSLLLARAELLPEVERAFIDGRYVMPPPPR